MRWWTTAWQGMLMALLAFSLAHAAESGETKVSTTRLTARVSMLVGEGGNVAVLQGPEGVVLVDDQYAVMSERIRLAVRALTPQPIRFVMNTHWHEDHSGGNEAFRASGAVIVAHDGVRARMSAEQFVKAFFKKTPASPAGALPNVTFSESLTLHLNDEVIRAVHVPNAHTDGDSVFYFERANVLHTGDVFFSNSYPFIDIWTGGSLAGTIEAAEAIIGMADDETKIIPGHGPVAKREDVTAYRDMLVVVRKRIQTAIASGTSEKDLDPNDILRGLDPKWGDGIMSAQGFLVMAYRSEKGTE